MLDADCDYALVTGVAVVKVVVVVEVLVLVVLVVIVVVVIVVVRVVVEVLNVGMWTFMCYYVFVPGVVILDVDI